MNLALKIARRYLFSRKSHSAINAISIVSMCGVAITTVALICALSIYNGFGELIGTLYSTLDPEIKITPRLGKTFDLDKTKLQELSLWNEIEIYSPVLEEQALAVFGNKQVPVLLKGVPDNFAQLTAINTILLGGEFSLGDSLFCNASLGVGISNQLAARPGFIAPLQLYAPRREGKVNTNNPLSAFNVEKAYVTSVFSVNQAEYDNQLVILPIATVRRLFDYNHQASAIELKLKKGANQSQVIADIEQLLGPDYVVKNRLQQQETAFRMMQIEKWITFLILAFILMIAIFNVIGSLSMLIIDKKDDIDTLHNLGATPQLITRIFLLEGWLIAAIGAIVGLALGVMLVLLQQHFGFLTLGGASGTFVVDAYPVKLLFTDLLIVSLAVGSMGFFAAWFSVRSLKKSLIQ